MDRCGFKESTLYKEIQEGSFPRPVNISERCVAWREDQIDEWCKAKAEGRTLRYDPPASSRKSRPSVERVRVPATIERVRLTPLERVRIERVRA
jgi:prophage regulatory protein